jgi:hypothetical protein
MSVDDALPPDVIDGATLRGQEYAWKTSAFAKALAAAQQLGYACLGGRFQFRLRDGSTCEMYWLNADSTERSHGESWSGYSHRSCQEVATGFRRLLTTTDFQKEASDWQSVHDLVAAEPDLNEILVFQASFVTELEYNQLSANVKP